MANEKSKISKKFAYRADNDSTAGRQSLVNCKFQLVYVALNQHYMREEKVLKTPATSQQNQQNQSQNSSNKPLSVPP